VSAESRLCAFCEIVAERAPAHLVAADDDVVAFLDLRPLFRGHVLVVPRQHVATLIDLPVAAIAPLFRAVQRLDAAVEQAMAADGSLILENNVISQSVPHLHVHVIPRRRKDGLRFWLGPRQRYESDEDAAAVAATIAAAYDRANLGAEEQTRG
jgi:histidine triad (HIT) family protein